MQRTIWTDMTVLILTVLVLAGGALPAAAQDEPAETDTSGRAYAPVEATGWPAWTPYQASDVGADADTVRSHNQRRDPRRVGTQARARWMAVDPLADEYPAWSPYNYGVNNPLVYVDPNGKEIRIHYEDENGDTQSIQYMAGMEYDGDNTFVGQMVGHLNAIAGTDAGGTVVGDLVASEDVFNVLNEESSLGIEGAAFSPRSGGGGNILAGGLSGMNSINAIETLAHEAFHGYQHLNGVELGTVNAEVQAYLFDEAVMGYPLSLPPGSNPVATNYYRRAMSDMLEIGYSYTSYSSAVHSFKDGSSQNIPRPNYPDGPYHNYSVRPPYGDKPLVAPFLPVPIEGVRLSR